MPISNCRSGAGALPDDSTPALAASDLLRGTRFTWNGKYQHLRLTPDAPYAIWRVQQPTA